MDRFYDVDNFCPETSIGYLVRRVHQLGLLLLDPVFAEEGITASQWSTLVAVYLGKAGTTAALAREIGYDQGAMTRLLDQLVARGLMERRRDGEDRRVVNLKLTPAGEAVTRRCKEWVLAEWNGWLAGWSEAEFDGLVTGLQRLKGRLDELSQKKGIA